MSNYLLMFAQNIYIRFIFKAYFIRRVMFRDYLRDSRNHYADVLELLCNVYDRIRMKFSPQNGIREIYRISRPQIFHIICGQSFLRETHLDPFSSLQVSRLISPMKVFTFLLACLKLYFILVHVHIFSIFFNFQWSVCSDI